ncbi:flagellin [Sulfurospirillum sp. UCH001]|uniref:flagellin N-terminal helical domain-containing protein n=1 Tax=Sulfurospirillum sp. UCH001 TaxID=1581011 RepID=UPI0008356CF7|nr:flagellin [Sulfurospirillum sp. UCH001]
MGFRINTNVASLTAQTSAAVNNRNLDNSLSKLSSGLRINKAADDASGLAIANSLRAQASSLGQAINNGNDAIGLIQTADGALSEYSNILDTIKTKSVQAASDGQNAASRLAIQKDINRLLENLNNIAKTTSFNGQKLLSGTFTNKEFQVGANANETIKASIASAETSQIGQTSRAKLSVAQLGENQLTLKSAVSGTSIALESVNLQMNNDPANGMGALADIINKHSAETGITAKAVVSSTTAAITAGTTGSDFAINGVNIGAINVSANDSQGTLLTAINNKSTETGVTATKTADGKLTLTSSDGRAISVTGDLSGVTSSTADSLSTIGHLEVVQAGSSTFQITGSKMGAAVGKDITTAATVTTVEDSTLAIGSSFAAESTLAAGSTVGGDFTLTASFTASNDTLLKTGSTIAAGSTISKDTTLGATVNLTATATLSSDMLIKAGSVLATGSILDAGTTLTQDIDNGGTLYKAGTTLHVDLVLADQLTVAKDMLMKVDTLDADAAIAAGSKLLAGTVLGADIQTSSLVTTSQDMVIKDNTVLVTGSIMKAGTVLGDKLDLGANTLTTTIESKLAGTSVLSTGATIKESSTLGAAVQNNADVILNQDMVIKAGSILATGTTLKAGTVINQDLTAAQVGSGSGPGIKAGTTLGTDVALTASVVVSDDFTMIKGTSGTNATIKLGSTIAMNANGGQDSVALDETEFSNLSKIDVTTLEGAMKAIDTVSAAMTNLDTIRSDLGSVQNQITSTINNISVTQVNVKSAESGIRDVDFAAESANFSKFNILAQSGSYAMSQANSVQQNVLKLLQ